MVRTFCSGVCVPRLTRGNEPENVDENEHVGYYSLISKPMSISQLRKDVYRDGYNVDCFEARCVLRCMGRRKLTFPNVFLQADVKLLTSNALKYFTSPADPQHVEAQRLAEEFMFVVTKVQKKVKKATRKVDKQFAKADRKRQKEEAAKRAAEVRAQYVNTCLEQCLVCLLWWCADSGRVDGHRWVMITKTKMKRRREKPQSVQHGSARRNSSVMQRSLLLLRRRLTKRKQKSKGDGHRRHVSVVKLLLMEQLLDPAQQWRSMIKAKLAMTKARTLPSTTSQRTTSQRTTSQRMTSPPTTSPPTTSPRTTSQVMTSQATISQATTSQDTISQDTISQATITLTQAMTQVLPQNMNSLPTIIQPMLKQGTTMGMVATTRPARHSSLL